MPWRPSLEGLSLGCCFTEPGDSEVKADDSPGMGGMGVSQFKNPCITCCWKLSQVDSLNVGDWGHLVLHTWFTLAEHLLSAT